MSLEREREKIDEANRKIVEDIRERMDVVEKIAEIKQKDEENIRDREREEEVKNQFEKLFGEKNMPPKRGGEFAELLIETAVEIQEEEIKS